MAPKQSEDVVEIDVMLPERDWAKIDRIVSQRAARDEPSVQEVTGRIFDVGLGMTWGGDS